LFQDPYALTSMALQPLRLWMLKRVQHDDGVLEMKRLAPIALALSLAACATVSPEAKVRNALLDVGLSPPMAECMAERLVDRLSLAQLRRLNSLAKLPGRDIGNMTVDEFLYRTRALQDPEIFSVVSRAGLGCAIAG
jgi:hypothetical protein